MTLLFYHLRLRSTYSAQRQHKHPSAKPGHDHHLDFRSLKSDCSSQLDARHVWHFNTGQKKMDTARVISGLPEGVLPAPHREHIEAAPGQRPNDERQDKFFIISDKNGPMKLSRIGQMAFQMQPPRSWHPAICRPFQIRLCPAGSRIRLKQACEFPGIPKRRCACPGWFLRPDIVTNRACHYDTSIQPRGQRPLTRAVRYCRSSPSSSA